LLDYVFYYYLFLITFFSLSLYSIDREIRSLYGLTVLRFFKDFETCMAVEPRHFWSGTKQHPFVQRVKEAMNRCDISGEAFEQWQTDVKTSFKARNAYALSIDRIDGKIDSRTLIEMQHSTGKLVQSLVVTINKMSDQIAALNGKMDGVLGTMKKLDHKSDDVIARFQNLNLGNNEQTQQQQDDEVEDREIILLSSYSGLMRTGQEMPVREIAFNWFRYDVKLLFERERDTLSEKIEKTRLRSHFSGIKTTMHVVIKNLDNYPGEMPTDPNMIAGWETLVKSEVAGALEKIRPHVKSLSKKNVRALVKDYNEEDFPEGTPEEVERFFHGKGNNYSGRRKRSGDESGVADESAPAEESDSDRNQKVKVTVV
jgi:hypothetical protein